MDTGVPAVIKKRSNGMTETKRCCEKCKCPPNARCFCFNHKCECHTPVSEPENIPPNCGCECHEKFTYKSHGNCCFILKPLPTPTPPPTEGWRKEFEKNYLEYSDGGVRVRFTGKNDIDIDDFITQALAEQKARMVEVVEGMKKEEHEGECGCNDWDCLYEGCRYSLQNETIEHIIKALSK